mgnify:CR=1 FL=1
MPPPTPAPSHHAADTSLAVRRDTAQRTKPAGSDPARGPARASRGPGRAAARNKVCTTSGGWGAVLQT